MLVNVFLCFRKRYLKKNKNNYKKKICKSDLKVMYEEGDNNIIALSLAI